MAKSLHHPLSPTSVNGTNDSWPTPNLEDYMSKPVWEGFVVSVWSDCHLSQKEIWTIAQVSIRSINLSPAHRFDNLCDQKTFPKDTIYKILTEVKEVTAMRL